MVSHGYGLLGGGRGGGGGWYAFWTNPRGLVTCRLMPERFPSVSCYTDDTRSHRCPGVQLCVGSNRNWPVFLKRP